MLQVERTIISQYANSATLVQLIQNANEYFDPRTNFQAFYDFVWNVDTARGFGLDILGRIVGVDRLLQIPSGTDLLGFNNASVPPDWRPFGSGTFYKGQLLTNAFFLPDDAYRVLILTKALANIVETTARGINTLLRNLFPDRARAYVIDLGNMALQYTFEFDETLGQMPLAAWELAMLIATLPHPTGVQVSVVSTATEGFFGFQEAGDAQPFDVGVFFA